MRVHAREVAADVKTPKSTGNELLRQTRFLGENSEQERLFDILYAFEYSRRHNTFVTALFRDRTFGVWEKTWNVNAAGVATTALP